MVEANLKSSFDRPTTFGIVLIILLTFIAYIHAIQAGFIWDDPDYVITNHTLRDFQGLAEMWTNPRSLPQWYPLVHTTFWIEYHLWGLNPHGYHVVNVLLHIASSLLLWRVLSRLHVPGAWLAGAIFALHPVHVESVAWITERKNVLSAVFALLSLLAYLKFVDNDEKRARPLDVDRYYVWSLVFFVAALLSKSVTATLPGVLGVMVWWKRGTIRWRDLAPLVLFVVIGAASGLHTAYIEMHHVGAMSDRIVELDLSLLDRFVLAGRVIWFYFTKLLIPWPLVFIYPQWVKPDATVWWQWVFPMGVIVGLLVLLMSAKRFGKGPAVTGLVFCGALFPALGFLNVYPMRFSYVADHFQYHASMALIAALAAGVWVLAGRAAATLLIPLLLLTFVRARVFHSEETLWLDTIAKNPDSWMVNTNLAHVYRNDGRYDLADRYYLRALELRPDIHDTHTNVGMAYGQRREFEKALYHLNEALKVNPDFAPAYYSIGLVYQLQGRTDLALESFRIALEKNPSYPEANHRLGRILERQGNTLEAIERYRLAVGAQPASAEARYDLAVSLLGLKQFPEAAANLLEVVRLRPDWAEAWSNLGASQFALGRADDAARSYERALRLKPDLAQARLGLQQARGR